MEHGIVTSVTYEDGVVYCQLRTARTTDGLPGIPVLKPHSGFIQVPSQGDVVTVEELSDGTSFITNVAGQPGGVPDDMKEGELTIQLDNGTRLAFERNSSGNYDVHLESSGEVVINGVSFSDHTHEYEDSTTDSTSQKETSGPT